MKKRVFLLAVLLLAEAALVGLSLWQWGRYQQRLAVLAQHAATPAEELHIVGWQPPMAALTNQPSPASGQPGWRLLALAHTAHTPSLTLIDLGWAPAKVAAEPDFSTIQATLPLSATLVGHWQAFPQRRGWLKGPIITTHPQLLAFLDPSALASTTLTPHYFQLTQSLPGLVTQPSSRPPGLPPQRHLAYALQWGLMAIILPLLALGAWLKRRHSR